jgi:predicted nucleic acid-binding protein
VDSSIWIDFWRSGQSKEAAEFERLARNDQVCITDIIRVELLSGARTEPEYRRLEDDLAGIPILSIPEAFWNQVAYARFQLARKGIQASIPDVSIAVLARHYGCPLLTGDRLLATMASVIHFRSYEV